MANTKDEWGNFFPFDNIGKAKNTTTVAEVRTQVFDVEDKVVLSNASSLVELYTKASGAYNPFGIAEKQTSDELLLSVRDYTIKDGELHFNNDEVVERSADEEPILGFLSVPIELNSENEKCLLLRNSQGSNSSVIFAHKALNSFEIEICFRNKIAEYFDFNSIEFVEDLEVPVYVSNSMRFHFNPLALRASFSCTDDNGSIDTSCAVASIKETTATLLRFF